MTTQVQAQDKTVTVNGLNLHYLDWGTPGAPRGHVPSSGVRVRHPVDVV